MDTFVNKPKKSKGSAIPQPKTTPGLATQQPKTPLSPPAQPLKAAQVPTPQPARDIPRPKPASTAAPTQEDIAKRAYEIYIRMGRPEGQSDQIWTQAEQELKK